MVKALFFDIDGTLVSFSTHSIPPSTIKALEAAKSNGVGIYISTGRPVRLINNLAEIKHLIDGYITANGAYSFIGSKVAGCIPVTPEEAEAMIKAADEEDFAVMMVGEHDLTVHNPNAMADKIFRQLLNVSDLGENVTLGEVLSQRIIQMTPIITEEQEQRLMAGLPGCVSARWHPDFTDITARGADKGSALETMAHHLGIGINETMAFGDGGNDISIIKTAGTGVAMGNATDGVKAVADYVTGDIESDGISNALRKFGII